MSADNWAKCPRCTRRGNEKLAARALAIQASYGKVPVEEFDAARQLLAADTAEFEKRQHTFREDYEIYGAEDGEINVEYSGSCGACGLSFNFKEIHPIPGSTE